MSGAAGEGAPRASFAEVNGVRLWYEEQGGGEPVLQIHGAGFGHFNFATATPVLSRSFRVIDYDMRGYGHSDRPIQSYDMELWADDAVGLLDQLGVDRAHVHGTSMGGMVAQVLAAKHPDRVGRLVLNCTAAKLDRAGRLTFRGWIDVARALGCGSRTLAELIALQALSRRFLDGEGGAEAVDMIQDILERSNRVEVFCRACQAMIDMDLRPFAGRIRAPTLVIGGDEDIMTPWEPGPDGAGQGFLARSIEGAVRHVIRGSGHSTLFDGTEENCRVVADFLAGRL